MKLHSSWISRIFLLTFVASHVGAGLGKSLTTRQQGGLPSSFSTSTLTTKSTVSTPQPSTPVLVFEPSLTYTACSTGVINWLFAGPSTPELTIIVNDDVPQDDPPPPLPSSSSHIQTFSDSLRRRQNPTSGSTLPDTINNTLASNLDPTSDSYSWPSVDVPQGWYQALAIMPTFGQIAQSDPFYVRLGTNTSCLVAATPTSFGTHFSTSPPSTGNALAVTSSVVPLPGGASSSHTSTIAGGIIGGISALLLGCICGIAALLRGRFCTYRKHKSRRHSASSNTRTTANPELTLRSGIQSLRCLSSSLNPFNDIPFAQEYTTSAERRMSSLSSPLPDIPVDTSQPQSRALLTVTAPSTEEVDRLRSSLSVPSTAPPSYESPPLSPLPPSLHSFDFSPGTNDFTRTSISMAEIDRRRSSFSVPSTALPLYESPPLSPLPPSFHSVDFSARGIDLETSTLRGS